MQQKTIKFFQELHKRLHTYRNADRLTFVYADSMDDFCLQIGYACAVAAYEALPEEAKQYVFMSRDKSNPMFYMTTGLVAAPPKVLFYTDVDRETGKEQTLFNFTDLFTDHTIKLLYNKYA